jgi:hypothetical protein
MRKTKTKHPFLAPMLLMPTAPGTCAECAANHGHKEPHNQKSLAYQYDFYGKHGRWPTWDDAMAHCPPEIKRVWITELLKVGEKL